LPQSATKVLASWVQRGMQLHINIQEGEILISNEQSQETLSVQDLTPKA
jgi:uncharacterized protein YaeQ